ncbi:MAG TPA: glycoside hydrolase family 127 protein, partial [Clostridia bacterium]|nr:glycoside hydrolase family 127 protein [Clostridia bacterium]
MITKARIVHRLSCHLLCLLMSITALSAFCADYPVQPVPFTSVRITGGFWQHRQETNRVVTVPYALQQCEETKRLQNFDLAAETMKRRASGESTFQHKPLTIYPFDDSDVFKAVEGASFALSMQKDEALEAKLDNYISKFASAQEPDGYLYTFRTMHPDSPAHDWIDAKRWLKDPILSHELYNLGHLYEAGVAHFQATGKTNLLDICLKSADLIDKDFGQGQLRIAPGHQVIEMGLAKLYRATGDQRYLNLAKFFLDVRGPKEDPYNQRHLRVIDQTEAVGHAVRANYMYSGMADVAALTGDERYLKAITRIWENVVSKKLHITGGVGARAAGEAYGENYELPNNCYNETCAAIAFLMWNHRMFLMSGEGKFMDVFERTLYNGFPSGVSLSGDRFFYPNPLEYDGKAVNNHGHAGRAPWFGCACCPPNVLRTLAALTGYFYAVRDEQLFVNLYAQSEASAVVGQVPVKLSQETDYPWNGKVKLTVSPERATDFTLCLRLPGWVQGQPLPSDLYSYENAKPAAWSAKVNGRKVKTQLENGYLSIARNWKAGDTVTLELSMEVRRVKGHANIQATVGRVALERGPLVYCLEGVDNNNTIFDCVVPKGASIKPIVKKDLLGGVTVLSVKGAQRAELRADEKITTRPATLTAIPYALWNNRGLSP